MKSSMSNRLQGTGYLCKTNAATMIFFFSFFLETSSVVSSVAAISKTKPKIQACCSNVGTKLWFVLTRMSLEGSSDTVTLRKHGSGTSSHWEKQAKPPTAVSSKGCFSCPTMESNCFLTRYRPATTLSYGEGLWLHRRVSA